MASIGAVFQAVAFLILVINVIYSLSAGDEAVPIPGTRGRWNGRPPRRHPSITLRSSRRSAAGARSGT